MNSALASNSANGMVTLIAKIACTTGVAFTVSAPVHAATTPAIKSVSVITPNLSVVRPMHPAWAELHSDLLRWQALPADWDGDDGIAPTEATVHGASFVLDKLKAAHICPPEASVAGDGEIAYTWSVGSSFASIAFLADGHIVAYSRVADRAPIEMDEPFNQGVDLTSLFESLRDLA